MMWAQRSSKWERETEKEFKRMPCEKDVNPHARCSIAGFEDERSRELRGAGSLGTLGKARTWIPWPSRRHAL